MQQGLHLLAAPEPTERLDLLGDESEHTATCWVNDATDAFRPDFDAAPSTLTI
jgi:hypothetical protein